MCRSDFSDIAGLQASARCGMLRYRREYMPGGMFFFTVNLLECRRRLLVEHVDDLRASFLAAWLAQPSEVIAIVVLPEHLQCAWCLPEGDSDNAYRWGRIKSGFCRRLPAGEYRSDVRIARRERGIRQRRFRARPFRDEIALAWSSMIAERYSARGDTVIDRICQDAPETTWRTEVRHVLLPIFKDQKRQALTATESSRGWRRG
jgi:putative transposase